MKTIQLKGAALEAAVNCRAISDAHDKGRQVLIEKVEAEMATFCKITHEETSAQLAIIERETGINLTKGAAEQTCQLDLRYVHLGLAFVNVQDDADEHTAADSQLLS